MTVAACHVEISPAMRTETLTGIRAKNPDRNLQHDLLKYKSIKIDYIILIISVFKVFRNQLLFFRQPVFSGNKSISEVTFYRKMSNFQTPAAIQGNRSLQIPIDKHVLKDSFNGTENFDLLNGKITFFLFRQQVPKPIAIFMKLKIQSLFRDSVDNNFHNASSIVFKM
jgi:hypothetical protein